MRSRFTAFSFAGVLAVTSLVAGVARSGAQASSPSGLRVLRASAGPELPVHSHVLGAVSSSEAIRVDVTLKLPDPAAVTAFIASLSDRSSADFHHFLRPGQFGQLFGPPLSEVASVDAVLRSDGLKPGQVTSDHLSIPVTAPARVIERAFHIRLLRYRLPGGRTAWTTSSAPSISAVVADDVEGVVGLGNLDQPRNMLARSDRTRVGHSALPMASHQGSAAQEPCSQASAAAIGDGLTADQLAAQYDMTPLYSLDDFGQGVNVALVEFESEPTVTADVAAYQACYGTDATVNYISVDSGPEGVASDPTGLETALDIEDVIGLAPEASVDVYQGPFDTDQEALDMYGAIINADTDQIISTSWGECELDSDSSLIESEQPLFEQAAAQGQAVFAAAGDDGSTDCYSDVGTTNGATLAVDDPGSQPYVTDVGGTSLVGSSETVWNDSDASLGAGGGGVSSYWCMPSYQDQPTVAGIIGPDSTTDSTDCGTSTPYIREVPDVSADADPDSGYVVYNDGYWQSIGGTSGAAPLWAAAAALIDSSPFCSDYGAGDIGGLPEGLYTIASSNTSLYSLAFNDITTGNNDYLPSGYSAGLYPATTGYDMASGLGSMQLAHAGNFLPGLAAQVCFAYSTDLVTTSITDVSPNVGPSSGSTAVTITGSGFLPIAGADVLEVGSQRVTVSCSSTTECTGTLPPTAQGTVNLVMSVEDLTTSPLSESDEFTFVAGEPPVVKVTSPAQVFQLGKNLLVKYSASGDLPVASYDARYQVSTWDTGDLGQYVYPARWQATKATSESLAGLPGNEYCFAARAETSSGTVSQWSANRCTALPLGSGALALVTSGWTRHAAKGFYLGSYVETTNDGSELRLAGAMASRVELIVTECPKCGTVTVFLNGRTLKTVSTYARTTEHGVAVTLPSFSRRRATIVLRATSKEALIVEGIGID